MTKYKPCKIVVHNDTDGGASAVCIINHIEQKYGKDAEWSIWAGTYTSVDMYVERLMDNPEQFERVFIADISVKPELAKQFPDNFILLDHHESAALLNGINGCIVDTRPTVCGATLCYKHLLLDLGYKCDHLKKLVAIARDYDCWIHALPKSIAKNLNFLYYRKDMWIDGFIRRFKDGFDKFTPEEVIFLTQKWKDIKTEIETTDYKDIMGDPYKGKFCLIVLPSNTGEVNELCEHALKNLKFEVVMTVNPKKNKISTRISDHAAKQGLSIGMFHSALKIGGGHPQAGGATYQSQEHLEEICEALAEKIIELSI